jgi:hypothetical protein
VPPAIIDFVKKRRSELAEQKTRLEVKTVGDTRGCRSYINGVYITEKSYVVAPDHDYFVRMDCGRQRSLVWRVRPKRGEVTEAPITDIDPLDAIMPDASFKSRERAEQRLELIAHWGDLDTLIGVSQHTTKSSDESVLAVRVEQGQAFWSDGHRNSGVGHVLSRLFPEDEAFARSEKPTAGKTPPRTETGSDVFGYTLVGVGLASLGTSGVLLGLQSGDTRRYRCSTGAASECTGVDPITTNATGSEVRRRVNGMRLGAGIAATVGVGLLTWGIVRLTTSPAPTTDTDVVTPASWQIRPVFAPGRAGASFELRF